MGGFALSLGHAVRPTRRAARGKKAKVILTAVARKLLVIANAVIRTGRKWALKHSGKRFRDYV